MWCVISLVAMVRRRWCSISNEHVMPMHLQLSRLVGLELVTLRLVLQPAGSKLRLLRGIRVSCLTCLGFGVWATSVQPSAGQALELG